MTERRTTTERGYGWTHQQRRTELLDELRDGDPCPRCGEPMYAWQDLEADHIRWPLAQYPDALADALSHKPCNRRAGALLAQQRRGLPPSARRRPLPEW